MSVTPLAELAQLLHRFVRALHFVFYEYFNWIEDTDVEPDPEENIVEGGKVHKGSIAGLFYQASTTTTLLPIAMHSVGTCVYNGRHFQRLFSKRRYACEGNEILCILTGIIRIVPWY